MAHNYDLDGNRRMPLHALQNVNEDMEVMHEEIFGPILPIVTYADITEVPNRLNPAETRLPCTISAKIKVNRNTCSITCKVVVFVLTILRFTTCKRIFRLAVLVRLAWVLITGPKALET